MFWLGPIVAALYDDKTRVKCTIPTCHSCVRRRRWTQLAAIALWVVLLASVGLAASGHLVTPSLLAALISMVAAPVITFVGPSFALPNAYVSRDGQTLLFRPSSPAFRAAIGGNN